MRPVPPPDWVNVQHKTMLRWINSKLDTQLTDLSRDLSDGLVLIKLINTVITQIDLQSTDLKLYLLTPLYAKPKFDLQKLENVNDFLEFIRIVLKINITGITNEHIVQGNLKLILGLIWSIFIFSTSNSIGIMNDGNSIIEIKSILLAWVNKNFKLAPVVNFNRDWSLEVSQPDIIFQTILKNYLPSSKLIRFVDSKFQNLKNIIHFAEQLGIKKLADIEDFKTLVPDEKSILFYLLEWYQFFELNIHGYNFNYHEPINLDERTDKNLDKNLDKSLEEDETYDNVIVKMLDVIKCKYEYETQSLRLSNRINTINNKIDKCLKGIKDHNISGLLKYWEYQFGEKITNKEFTKEFNDLTLELIGEMDKISGCLQDHEEINNSISKLTYQDMKQLEHLNTELTTDLNLLIKHTTFHVTKSLELDNLQYKLDRLTYEQTKTNEKIKEFNESVLQNPIIKKINDYLIELETFLKTNSGSCHVEELLNNFEKLINFIHKVDYSSRNLTITKSPKNLKYIKSFEGPAPESIALKYDNFKAKLLDYDQKLIVNENEFKTIMITLTSDNLNGSYIKNFINLIPLKIINLNFNDSDFSLLGDDSDNDTSNESEIDNSNLIFEGSRTKVSNQLGSDRIYDLTQFFSKFEDGLKL